MLEDEDYQALDIVFPFFFTYAETCTGFSEESPLEKTHAPFADVSVRLRLDSYYKLWYVKDLANMRETLCNFKKTVWKFSLPHYDRELNKLKCISYDTWWRI